MNRSRRRRSVWPAVVLAVLLCLSGTAVAGGSAWHVLPGSPAEPFYYPPMCVDSSHCWVSSQGRDIVRTGDGGRHWKRSQLPPGDTTRGVWCTTINVCWAPLYTANAATRGPLLGSTDGGRNWHAVRISGPRLTSVDSLACAGPEFCLGTAIRTLGNFGFQDLIVSTTDGGITWRASYPAGFFPLAVTYRVSCPAVRVCFAAGFGGGAAGSGRAAVVVTTDGGVHWRTGRVPGGIDLFWDLSCVGTRRCWAVGRTGEGPSDHGVIVATTDGGSHWHSQAPPPGTLSMNGISCVDARHCTTIGFHHDLSTVVATTSDGGASWRTEAAPAGATFLSSVWCSTARRCIAPLTYHYGSHGSAVLAATY